MAKLPVVTRVASGLMASLCAAALIDHMGKYYWFRPYDEEVFWGALLVALLWYLIFGPQMEAWMKEEREMHDREDYPEEFKDR